MTAGRGPLHCGDTPDHPNPTAMTTTTDRPTLARRRLIAGAACCLTAAAATLLALRPASAQQEVTPDAQPQQQQQQQQQPAAAAASGGVGVVDVAVAIQESARGQQLREENRQYAERTNAELQQLQQQAQAEQQAIADLREGTPERLERERNLRRLAGEGQLKQQLQRQEIELASRDAYVELYDRMTAAVEQVARERGLSVVIRKTETGLPEDLSQVTIQQIEQVLARQQTLYVSPGADVTTEVIQKMDAAQ